MTLVKWYGAKASAAECAGAIRGLTRATEELLTRANVEVPIEDSDLLKSGTPSVDEASLKGAVSYGDMLSGPYAVKQHEDLTYQHDDDRKAKYLEDPLNGMKSDGTYNRIMGEEIGRKLR